MRRRSFWGGYNTIMFPAATRQSASVLLIEKGLLSSVDRREQN